MSKKYKKICKTLNWIENLFILPSTVTWCVSISPSASSVGIPVSIASSAVGNNIVQLLQELTSISQ